MSNESMKTEVWFEKAVSIYSYLEDYEGTVEKWKHDFYEMWRWQMGYGFAHKIDLIDTRDRGVYISLLVKPAYKNSVIKKMEEYGYGNIRFSEERVAMVETYDFPDDVFEVVAE